MQPLHTINHAISHQKNHAISQQNIVRIAKRCPENITSVVKCVKLHFPKKTRKKEKNRLHNFLWRGCLICLTTVTTVAAVTTEFFCILLYFLSTFGKRNLTHLTTDMIFSGLNFAIISMFFLG